MLLMGGREGDTVHWEISATISFANFTRGGIPRIQTILVQYLHLRRSTNLTNCFPSPKMKQLTEI